MRFYRMRLMKSCSLVQLADSSVIEAFRTKEVICNIQMGYHNLQACNVNAISPTAKLQNRIVRNKQRFRGSCCLMDKDNSTNNMTLLTGIATFPFRSV
jgi:hypothetical protein